jgi:hypothetical protein
MVPWHVLLILLIPVVVAILANLLRGAEQKNRKDRPASSSGEFRTPTRQSSRPSTDLDRFLEEARRRREPPIRSPVVVEREAAQAARPEPAPRSQRPTRPTPTRPRETRVPPRRQPVLLEEETSSRRSVPVVTPEPAAEPVRAVEVSPAQLPAPPPAPAVVRVKAISPLLRQVVQGLRTPRSAAAAIVLREVFDQPLCKRRR